MERHELDSIVDNKIGYTLKYAVENFLFYRKWFDQHNVSHRIKGHEDLLEFGIGGTHREESATTNR